MMIPLLIPQSQRQNVLLAQTLPQLTSRFEIREIQDSPTTPGDLIFPSFGIACLLVLDVQNMDDMIDRAEDPAISDGRGSSADDEHGEGQQRSRR